MTDLTFTVGDTGPDLTFTVNADLTGSSAEIHVQRPDTSLIVRTVTTSGKTGSMPWQVGDLTLPGSWRCELQVTFASGQVQTFGPTSFEVQAAIA